MGRRATSVDPFFFWWVCGVTVSWKRSQASRVATVLCGGVGRDRYLWGRWLGATLSSLGADLANLFVTRICGDDNHVQYAASGTGFLAVSHGAQYVARTWAFGVAIAVRKDILGHCFGAQRDSVGDCWEWYTEFGRCASGQS